MKKYVMKKMCCRLMAVLFVVCVLLSNTVCAAETQGISAAETYKNAMQNLQNVGLMNGYDDGSFGEMNTMKRSELAALADRVLQLPQGGEQFADVASSHWAYQNIANVAAAHIFVGDDMGNFIPDGVVKFEEVTKVFVEMLASVKGETVECGYPYGYILQAAEWGILNGVDGAAGEEAPRGMIAQMLLNLLYAPLADGSVAADDLLKHVYYIAEDGDDAAQGTYSHPWQSLTKAAKSLSGGETAVCMGGQYHETADVVINRSDIRICGRAGERVRVSFAPNSGITVQADSVSLRNMLFVRESSETTTETDVFLHCTADELTLADCELNGFAIPFYAEDCKNGSVLRCSFDNADVGLTLKEAYDFIIDDCDFNYPQQTGVMLNGTVNIRFSNNLITGENDFSAGIVLQNNAQNVVLCNNIISLTANEAAAFLLENSESCYLYNNSVTGGKNAVVFGEGGNKNIKIKNNIFAECVGDAYVSEQSAEGLVTDYNLFYQTHPKRMEAHSQFGKPWFVNSATDWRISANSPAVGKGANLSDEDIDFYDRNGDRPSYVWNIGAYYGTVGGVVSDSAAAVDDGSVFEDFSVEAKNWSGIRGMWEVIDGVYMNVSTTGRNTAMYLPSATWRNFEFSADVKSPRETKSACTGLVFRADAEMKNQYAIRIYANQYLELVAWEDDNFVSLAQFPCVTEPETYYKMKVKAEGSHFTFYVDDEEVGSYDDSRYASGAIGLYAYSQMYEYDNIQAKPIQ